MPLQFQNVPISFSQGIDSKSDRKQVVPGKLLELENGVFTNAGAINKRFGYDLLSRSVDGGSTINAGAALATYQDELLAFDGTEVYSRVAATSKWSDRGNVVSVIVGSKSIVANGEQQLNPDLALSHGVAVYAWEDSRGGVRYSVVDSETGAFLVSDVEVSSSGITPKVIALSAQVLVFYIEGTSIKYKAINSASPTAIGSAVTLTTNLNSSHKLYDVCLNSDRLYVAFANASSGTSLIYLTTDLTASSNTDTSGAPTHCLTTWSDSMQRVWVAYEDGSAVKTYARSYTLASVLSLTTIETNATTANTITGIARSDGYNQLFYEFTPIGNSDGYIHTSAIDATGNVIAETLFARSVGLASKAFLTPDNTVHVNVAHESTLQSTYFTLDSSARVIAKMIPSNGGGLRTNNTLPQVDSASSGIYQFAACKKGKLLSELEVIFSLLGVVSLTLDFANANQFLTTELASNLFVIGGVVQSYDGVSFTEHSFNLYPEGLTLTPVAASGSLSAGSYQYIATYEWTDNNGRVQRSTTSPIQGVNTSLNDAVLVAVPTLRLTKKTGNRAPVRVVIYRSEVNKSTFYRVTSVVSPLFNDPTTDYVVFDDTLSDNTIISRERIYIDGGALDSDAPPACRLITSYRNRVWLSGLEDPYTLWFSQQLVDGEPMAFSEFLTVIADPRGGPITALGVLDDSLIIFKERAIFRLSGDGPNNTGQGQNYDSPQLVTTDVGCTNPNSVAITPSGLVFQSAKGLMLFDRSGAVSYIGAPVERYNALTISSTTVLADQNLVVFTTADNRALAFDYFFNQWSTFTNHAAVDSLIFDSAYLYLDSTGLVHQQNKTKFTDGPSLIPLKLKTGPINLAGLQGFQRVKRIAILGDFKGSHTLVLGVQYDFNDAGGAQYTINASTLFGANTWGSSTTWGSDDLYGGTYSPYHFTAHLSRQLCQSIAITLTDSQSSSYNEGYSISAITLEIGVKRGLNKSPAANKMG